MGAGWAWLLTAVLLWAPAMGFVALGLASLGRLLRGAGSKETEEKERRRAAVRGSVAWWGAAGLLALAVALLAWLA